MEDELKSTNKRKKAKIVIPDEEELVSDDPFKHGRMEETEYEDEEELVSEDPSKRGRMEEAEYADVEEENTGVEVQSQETFEAELRVLSLVSTAEDIQDTNEEQTKALEQQDQKRANLEAALKL
ncbi:hypothetical protein Tco_1152357 [Tanacetum coccineum]